MKHIIKRAGILFLIFAAALLILFFGRRTQMSQDEMVYVAMEEASLPVVTVEIFGRNLNRMAGYRQDMGNAAAEDSLTILPEDRVLPIHVTGSKDAILGISYEIRSLDLQRLVENTRLDTWETAEHEIIARLPIQNLLTKDRAYQLCLRLDTEKHGAVYYYTRIMWTDQTAAQSMIDLAVEFSEKTFNHEQAKSLAAYLETDPTQDNSSFAHTDIRSSFSHLTWGQLGVQPMGQVQVKLKELDGVMGCVQLDYLVFREEEEGEKEFFEVTESFTMKWNSLRTYLMDYERNVNQIFQGKRSDYAGKRIMLGITNDDQIEMKRSPDKNVYAYRINRELWSYKWDGRNHRAVKVFSFRGSDMTDIRSNDNRHDIRILQVDNEGNIDFLVYGYMNRGIHEGQMGIAGYRYDVSENALEELFFIQSNQVFAQLESDLKKLSYRTQEDMLYLLVDHAIYGIDLKSRENMVVADQLSEGTYAVSSDGSRIAWQDGGKEFEADLLHFMNLETGIKYDIHASAGEYVRTLGFVGGDLVYGIANAKDLWIENGRVKGLPMRSVKIINDQMREETSYEKYGYLISDVRVEESRIHLNRVVQSGGQFAPAQEDTIVCNADLGSGTREGIGWYASGEKGRVYFIQLDHEIKTSRNILLAVPKKVSYDYTDTLELQSYAEVQNMQFYAYGSGKLLGVTDDFARAVQMAYDRMGIVTDASHHILWGRVNRGSVRNLRDPQTTLGILLTQLENGGPDQVTEDGMAVLDARGCSMTQMLYFIDKGVPVIGYTGEGTWLMLCGFDQHNVTVYDPVSGETYKAGLNDSTEFFRQRGNDFICGVQLP
ncbi:MAG: hypothetical protein ACI39W_10010 [Brotaphodocola sp.]